MFLFSMNLAKMYCSLFFSFNPRDSTILWFKNVYHQFNKKKELNMIGVAALSLSSPSH